VLKAWVVKLGVLFAAMAVLWRVEGPVGWITSAVILLVGFGVMVWGVFAVNSSLWARTLWRGAPGLKRVALTFDDGPDPKYTPQVLEVLADKKVPAAFFVVGERAEAEPALLKAIHQAGHLIGNHSYTHGMWINFRFHRKLRDEIKRTNKAIGDAIGERPRYYRAPHGFKNPALGDVLAERDMVAIGWQVRGFDAVRGDAEKIARRVVGGVEDGGVVLLHDGAGLQGTETREATLEALPIIIDGLRAKGFNLVRLDDLLGEDPYF
jgi:peptidoglycan-N-acetylglucosamine deacetylase